MAKFALLAALLVASAGALNMSGVPANPHHDQVVYEIPDEQIIPQYNSSEHDHAIFVHNHTIKHEGEPAYGGPWHPAPESTNVTIYQVLSANKQ